MPEDSPAGERRLEGYPTTRSYDTDPKPDRPRTAGWVKSKRIGYNVYFDLSDGRKLRF